MKKRILLIISLFMVFGLLGCGKLDVNELTLATAIGIDKGADGKIKITAQVLNAWVLARNPRPISPVTVLEMEGDTVLETTRKFATAFRSKLFLFHFQVLLFGEDMAKEGIGQFLDFFFTDNETRHKYNIIVVEGGTASEVLKIQTLLNLIPIIAIEGKLDSALRYYGISRDTNIEEAIHDVRTEGVSLALGSIRLEGDPEKGKTDDNVKKTDSDAYLYVANIAVFKKDKFVGFLTEEESMGYNYIMGQVEATVHKVTLDDGSKLSVEVASASSSISLTMADNQPHFKIDIKVNAIIAEDMSGKDRFSVAFQKQVEEKTNQVIQKIVTDCISKVQNVYGSDILKLAEIIHEREPQYWKEIKDNYDTLFKNIDIKANVKTDIFRIKF